MVGNKRNPISGLSWADVVEKEEEEARVQLHQQQKPNPFGSARPREVVLEEKGIDWRKFDKKLHEPSNLSLMKERQLKENIPAPTEAAKGKQPYPPRSMGVDQKIETTKNGCGRHRVPLVCQTLQNQNLDQFVPPLRYPPKNTMCLMHMQWSNNHHRVEVGRANFRELYVERDSTVCEREMQWSLNSKRLDFSFQSQCNRNLDLHELHIERGRENTIRQKGEAHYMRTSSAHGVRERNNTNSMYEGRNFFEERFVSLPMVSSRGALTNHDIGWQSADEEFDLEKIKNEYGRRNGVRDGLMGPSWGHHKVLSPAIEESDWMNMDHEYGRRRFNVREFVCPLTGAVGNGGRAEAHPNVDIESMGPGKNNRKRGMKSGTSNSHHHQRKKEMDSKNF